MKLILLQCNTNYPSRLEEQNLKTLKQELTKPEDRFFFLQKLAEIVQQLSEELQETYKNSSFVGVDPDEYGIKEAKRLIKESGVEDRVSAECLGGESIDYNEEFDAATMMVVLHEIYMDVRSKAVENVYQALKKDGKLIIWDHAFPSNIEEFRNPLYEYGVVDEWYEVPFGNIHQTPAEVDHMLSDCGFKDINRFPMGKGMFEVIVASK